MTKPGMKNLWQYQGKICDMGLKADQEGNPAFYILTESADCIAVTITEAQSVLCVIRWLKHLNTGVKVEFVDYWQFNTLIGNIFNNYLTGMTA